MTFDLAPKPLGYRVNDKTKVRSVFSDAVNQTGLSHAEIARRANIDRSTVSSAVTGRKRASLTTCRRSSTPAVSR